MTSAFVSTLLHGIACLLHVVDNCRFWSSDFSHDMCLVLIKHTTITTTTNRNLHEELNVLILEMCCVHADAVDYELSLCAIGEYCTGSTLAGGET